MWNRKSIRHYIHWSSDKSSGNIWKRTSSTSSGLRRWTIQNEENNELNGLKRPLFCMVKGQLTVLFSFLNTLSESRHYPFTGTNPWWADKKSLSFITVWNKLIFAAFLRQFPLDIFLPDVKSTLSFETVWRLSQKTLISHFTGGFTFKVEGNELISVKKKINAPMHVTLDYLIKSNNDSVECG